MGAWYRPKRRLISASGSTLNFLDVLVDPTNPNVDIVAVHGLNPLDNKIHAEATWTSEGKLWLRDFLWKRIPRARIMLFGYNSNVAFGTAAAGVREQAENLLNQLAQKRMICTDRPLIFICHSLGGIVVKRAIVHASNDKTYQRILDSTSGIIFFGTPHGGGNNASLGDIVARIARTVWTNPENSFMEAITRDSLLSDILADDFRHFVEKFSIISFYESRPLGHFGIVVNKKSATLGLPGTREKQIPLDTDHSHMCKFDSEDNRMYRQVADNVVAMVEEATSNQKKQRKEEQSQTKGNISNTEGDSNTTTQAGQSNYSRTYGTGNETGQVGHSNRSEIDGKGNITTQVNTDRVDLGRLAELFLFKRQG